MEPGWISTQISVSYSWFLIPVEMCRNCWDKVPQWISLFHGRLFFCFLSPSVSAFTFPHLGLFFSFLFFFFFSLLMSSQRVYRLISHVSDPWGVMFHLSLGKGSRSWPVPLASCPHVRSSSVDYNQYQSSPSLPTSLLCHAVSMSLHLKPTWSSVACYVSMCHSTSLLSSFI